MFSGKPLPNTINSMNAYYGAGPILNALNRLCTMDMYETVFYKFLFAGELKLW